MNTDSLDTADLIGMLGGALIAVGVVVLGAVNTLTDNPHTEVTNDAGAVTAEPLVPADVRAYLVAAGLVIWGLYGIYKLTRPAETTEQPSAALADD